MDWKELFGSDDDDSDNEGSKGSDNEGSEGSDIACSDDDQHITTFDDIPGLFLIRQALDHQEQMTMTHEIINREYFSGENNQAMCFGELPSYISWINNLVIDKYPSIFNQQVLNREPLFDQAILNLYRKGLELFTILHIYNNHLRLGQGICSHVDLLRFKLIKPLFYIELII